MSTNTRWLAIRNVASVALASRQKAAAVVFLLERGVALVSPRCALCGVEFERPRLTGERFRVALQVFEPRSGREVQAARTRLLVGSKVLVARTAASLSAVLEHSVTYVGARVMVADVRSRSEAVFPILMCRRCAHHVSGHISLESEPSYQWDWLVDFRPRSLFVRLFRRISARKVSLRFLRFISLPVSR